jgi:preprotein translocase subunit SecE
MENKQGKGVIKWKNEITEERKDIKKPSRKETAF